VQFSILREILF